MNLHSIALNEDALFLRYMAWRYPQYEFRTFPKKPGQYQHQYQNSGKWETLYDPAGHKRSMESNIAQGVWAP